MTALSGYRDAWLSGVDGNDQGTPAYACGAGRTAEAPPPGHVLFHPQIAPNASNSTDIPSRTTNIGRMIALAGDSELDEGNIFEDHRRRLLARRAGSGAELAIAYCGAVAPRRSPRIGGCRGHHRSGEQATCPMPTYGPRSAEPQTASASLSLEDTSPPWSADVARPECGHCWRRPRDSEPPGHGAHPGPMCRAAESHSRNPS